MTSRLLRFVLAVNFVLLGLGTVVQAQPVEQRSLILVIGAAGEEEIGKSLEASAALWKEAATNGGFEVRIVGDAPEAGGDRVQLLTLLTNEVQRPAGELWVVMIGHGTFDGKSAKFNLRGPDISADELAAVLKPCNRTLAVIQCASASGPFLKALSAPGRVVVTATRSGYELNLTRFGDFFARGVADLSADLDKDGQTSLLEAYLMASRQVEEFYRESGRMVTEHALLDDNGDGLGTPPDWFVGVRAVKKSEGGKSVDGIRAHQLNFVRGAQEQQLSADLRERRDRLEGELTQLRERKGEMPEADYYRELERVLTEIARVYLAPET